MQNRGFDEEQAAYGAENARRIVGQVRRWGPAGPAYEIINVTEDGKAVCEVIYSWEIVTCPVSEVLEDPMAETIP